MTAVKLRKSMAHASKEKKTRAAATAHPRHATALAAEASRTKEAEERAALALFDQAGKLDRVACSTQEADTRDAVREVVADLLARARPVRVATASKILKCDMKTVRAWVREGVLTSVQAKPRLMLDAERLYTVAALVRDLRKAGRSRNLLQAVWRRLEDDGLLQSDELAEGLEQMRKGAGRPWREIRAEWSSKEPGLFTDED
ncbi:hypothetical protein DQ384_04800 [Sphaerisporangium album]|uniref:DNA-binding protein n=1 Tax=Sphaerisporangium album TaxID=509200 RepID=A0A367FSM4_9ACTN|nr:hypothetical protein [Sphaerisporangium album]RCG32792.1 hypothetical protein DQ384_04800 [Sphaerisporangium album]